MNLLVSCKHRHILLKNVFAYICDHFHMIWLQKCEIITYRNQSVILFRVGRKKKKKFQHCHWILLGLFYIVFHILLRGKLKGQRSLSLSLTFSAAKFGFNSSLHLLSCCVSVSRSWNVSIFVLTVRSTLFIAYVYISGLQKRSEVHHCKISYLVVTRYHIVL